MDCLLIKINLPKDSVLLLDTELIQDTLYKPLKSFLDSKEIEIKYKTLGIHTMGKDEKPHVHIHIIGENIKFPNFLMNYKYYYNKKYQEVKEFEYFQKYRHSTRFGIINNEEDCIDVLGYPYKEIINYEKDYWKAGNIEYEILNGYTQKMLIEVGSSRFIKASIEKNRKDKNNEKRLEKWGAFCLYMDELRKTPTVYELNDLHGVCTYALEEMRAKDERVSVNALITMCKDYAFKRNLWTNEQILEKYNIT